jgi:dTDP-4-dehydrorhamnose 3,5-epimerase
MEIVPTDIAGVVILEPRVFEDARGYFVETFHERRFRELGLESSFVQDNHSRSRRGVVRGLHYQLEHPQGKLCRVTVGEVFDVSVDLRRQSPTFGRWVGVHLSEANRRMLYVPPGIAHGFCVLSETADFLYKCTDYYHPEDERTLLWNDRDLAIDWPVTEPLVSEKDQQGAPFAAAVCYDGHVSLRK